MKEVEGEKEREMVRGGKGSGREKRGWDARGEERGEKERGERR